MSSLRSRIVWVVPRTLVASARSSFSGERDRLAALVVLVGVGAGLAAIALRDLVVFFTRLFSGHADPSGSGRVANPHVPALGVWWLVLAPVLGGLLYGPLVSRFAPEARGHGVPEVMLAVNRLGGRIRPRVPLVKSLASALCIGSGGSVGREGPIVQVASAIGSVVGQLARVPEERLRLLVACGAAGGIAATFNAPIAGVFFALEVILRDFAVRSFGYVVISAVIANGIGRLAFGSEAFLSLPTFATPTAGEYGLAVVLGVLAALVGVAFIRILYGSEDLADRIWHGPEWLRPAAGGVLLGLLLLLLPQLYGVGYPALGHAVEGHTAWTLMLLLLVGKLVATSLTMAIGGSGGVFAPSLFAGAMLGSAFGSGAHALFGGTPAGAFGLLGMGAVFAAAARAPITAVLIIFELTGDYAIVPPLMVAVVIATGLADRLSPDSIYTLKLRRRGIDLDQPKAPGLDAIPVSEAMRPLPEPLAPSASVPEMLARFASGSALAIPVVDADGATILGVVSAEAVEAALPDDGVVYARDIMHLTDTLHASDPLEHAIRVLAQSGDEGVPVLAVTDGQAVGWITHRDLLGASAQTGHQPSRRRGPCGDASDVRAGRLIQALRQASAAASQTAARTSSRLRP